jgi:chitinase
MAFGTRKTLCKFSLFDPKPRYSQISSGSVIQPHTNLTEIQRAAELLWRVNIPPSQVSMGFGFYGRAFTLADPSCNTPGCAFSGASTAGVCTDTGGYLAYYEIENILLTNPDISPVYDEEAAAKYFSWDTNQWISYDDAETFKAKVDWANSVGLGGSLIWASDLGKSSSQTLWICSA